MIKRLHAVALIALFALVCAGCTEEDNLVAPPQWSSPENFCASLPRVNGTLYYCGTVVGFLQGNLPNGWYGGCFPALTPNNGFTGYLGYSGSRGAAWGVYGNLGDAQDTCSLLAQGGVTCTGIIRCTRE